MCFFVFFFVFFKFLWRHRPQIVIDKKKQTAKKKKIILLLVKKSPFKYYMTLTLPWKYERR